MICEDQKYVSSEAEMLEFLQEQLLDFNSQDLVIMGGHFMLFYDSESNSLVPGVSQDLQGEIIRARVRDRVGIFPLYTWEMALKIGGVYKIKTKNKVRFLLLINDWQYTPEFGSAGEHRDRFYRHFQSLPSSYKKSMKAQGLFSEEDILPSRKNNLAFPETWLKYRFQKSATKLVQQGKLERKYVGDGLKETEISFVDNNGNYSQLISCGVTGCAGEITEMLREVYEYGHRLILIFAPNECHSPVKVGIEIALKLYELNGMKVIVADPGGSGEMSVDAIFNKLVSVSVFRS
ncbi:hypothetical protein ACJ6YJ_06525 [Pseudomonas marginalis]|jgi:hypothetical protein|uniref:hypothetical protein n=1 Tax=Pseudomonas TaxID=286 RepID=UPI00389AEC7C